MSDGRVFILNRWWRGGPNFCMTCGVGIDRRLYSIGGFPYRPLVCMPCAAEARRWMYTSSPPYSPARAVHYVRGEGE